MILTGKKREFTIKQEKFINEYIKLGNITEAAIAAGYKKKYAAVAGSQNMRKPHIAAEIERRLKRYEKKRVADAEEILTYLTSVVRGESLGEEIVVEGTGPGFSQARTMKKGPSEADRLQAAKLLAKRYNLDLSRIEAEAKAERLELENEKLKLEIDRLKGGSEQDTDDGFIEALNGSAKEDWADED